MRPFCPNGLGKLQKNIEMWMHMGADGCIVDFNESLQNNTVTPSDDTGPAFSAMRHGGKEYPAVQKLGGIKPLAGSNDGGYGDAMVPVCLL